jgi:AAA family ATP:ADP antiporter
MRSNPESSNHVLALPYRYLSRIVDVKPHETRAMLLGFAYFFCLLCGYYLLRPLRDAMGLVGGVGNLPWLFTATFVTMLLLVPVFGAIATRWPPHRFVPYVYRFFALNILVFGALFATGIAEVAVSRVFFVWISVFNLFVISIFWSVIADNFNSEQGRRLFGFIAAGGTAGALTGPGLAAVLVTVFGVTALTVVAAVLLELAVQCYRRLTRTRPAHDMLAGAGPAAKPLDDTKTSFNEGGRIGGGIFSGITLILRDRYLTAIVMYMLLHTFASTFLYFEQARIVAQALPDTASRTQLFAMVDLVVSGLTILLQIFITGRFLQRFGVAAALILLPVISMLALAGIAWWPILMMLFAVQGLRRSIDYAIVRPGREVLFTVVSREAKYKAKSVIETVIYRGGDAVSGWIFAGLSAIGIGFSGIAMIFLPLAAAWVGLANWLAKRQEQRASDIVASPIAEVSRLELEQGVRHETGTLQTGSKQ